MYRGGMVITTRMSAAADKSLTCSDGSQRIRWSATPHITSIRILNSRTWPFSLRKNRQVVVRAFSGMVTPPSAIIAHRPSLIHQISLTVMDGGGTRTAIHQPPMTVIIVHRVDIRPIIAVGMHSDCVLALFNIRGRRGRTNHSESPEHLCDVGRPPRSAGVVISRGDAFGGREG